MSGQTPEQEPSIEEILASIRQIISDDDEGTPAPAVEPEPIPTPEPEPAPVVEPVKEDILELRDPLPPEKSQIDMVEEEDEPEEYLPPEPEPEPAPVFSHKPEPEPVVRPEPVVPDISVDSILSDTARAAALSGFAKLAHTVPVERGTTPRLHDGVTIEDIVRDMLQPMLRDWLDDNLPGIIEKLVQKELEKLARKAADD